MKFLLGAAAAVAILSAMNMSENPLATLAPSPKAAPLKFELYKDANQEFRWRLKAANGKIIAMADEGYRSKDACRNGIELIKDGASKAAVEDLTQD